MKNTINLTEYDRFVYDQTGKRSPALSKIQTEKQGTAYHDLLRDAFGAFYKYYPELTENIDADRQINQKIVTELLNLKEFEQLRNFTKGDPNNAVAAIDRVKAIWQSLPDEVKSAQDKVEQASASIDEALDGEGAPEELKKAFDALKKASARLEAELEEYEDEIRQSVRAGIRQAEEAAADGEKGAEMLGLGRGWSNGDGKMDPTSADEKLKIAQALKSNEKLRELIRLAGRMSNIAQKKQRQRMQYFRTEITGIETGDDLTAVVPSEFSYFVSKHKSLHTLFLKKLQNQELVQYEMEAREPKAQGPIINMVDCSGSMGGYPDTWSKAMCLAMYGIARLQKRDYAVMLFNDFVVKELFIAKGEHKAEELMTVLTAGVGGGTNFERPLTRALELIGQSQWNKADVIMITDGVCDITDTFRDHYNKVKAEKQFKTYTIIIGDPSGVKIAKKFSDDILPLNRMFGECEGGAFDLCFNI